MEIPRYRNEECEPQSLSTYLQDGRGPRDTAVPRSRLRASKLENISPRWPKSWRQRDIETRRYRATEIRSYRDMGIPRYRDQARKHDIPRLTEVPKDHDTESRETRIQEEYPRSPQDGPKTGQDGPKYGQDGPIMAQDNPRWPQDGSRG